MRPIFCGNIDYDTRVSELERLFGRYGRVDRVDMKSGFAFIYFDDERDGEDAIRRLDGMPFGYSRRRLSVEWARGDRGPRFRDGSRSANMRPTKTLFVIHFDPINTRLSDIERHFEPYGRVLNVRIRRNFAFVQFATQEEATKALEGTNMTKILDRVISVEYALRDDGERDIRDSPRGYGRRGGSPYGRSPSPMRRSRPSPDYGRRNRSSPDYGRRASPDYGRRPSPDYGHPRSPDHDRYSGPEYDRDHSPDFGRQRSRSPVGRPRS